MWIASQKSIFDNPMLWLLHIKQTFSKIRIYQDASVLSTRCVDLKTTQIYKYVMYFAQSRGQKQTHVNDIVNDM